MKTALFGLSLTALTVAGIAFATTQPYSGQDKRDIAALSPGDIDALLNGEGFGFAKPAELNGYPGPAHILELADDLELTADQVSAVQAIFDAMNAEARALGADLVAAEAALDAAFEDGTITAASLTALTEEAAAIEAKLRATHLAAHLEATPLLSRHQRMTYNTLRGYGDGGHSGHGDH
jgi:Spy/CpxP family protein refolding chaperone